MFGNPETTTGGRALKFYASIRLDIRRIASLKEGDVVIGSRAKVKVVKNKVAPPFREAEFDILYGEGISKEGDLLDLGVDHKVVEKSGAWYAFDGERMGQGRENARQFLKDNPDIRAEIDARLRKGLGLPVVDPGLGRAQGREGRRPADAGEEEGLAPTRFAHLSRPEREACVSVSKPVPCPTVSNRSSGRSFCSNVSLRISATRSARRAMDSSVTPPTCGVATTLSMARSGSLGSGGSSQ